MLHALVPLIVAVLFFRRDWKKAYLIMMATMIVDVDHLLATPIYDPLRCSIGFHPLHQTVPMLLYAVACFIPKLRYVGIGLVIHMALDAIDCQWTNGIWMM
ncbi:DUF6122 family protein [Sinobacterium norvegicum]|uniref:DUF6122 family protein n=1 Tax=Sinobacterium norvegicum TaxID=1641715 RepID=UPI003F494B51